jgi:hypothetical protein
MIKDIFEYLKEAVGGLEISDIRFDPMKTQAIQELNQVKSRVKPHQLYDIYDYLRI